MEGDGGFLQNIQELAVARKNLNNLGIYLWVNNGYASIRMTQKTYFREPGLDVTPNPVSDSLTGHPLRKLRHPHDDDGP